MTDLTNEDIKTGNVEVRAGYETRILATDLGETHPVCIAFKGNNGWRVLRLTEKGKQSLQEDRDYEYDLVRIPQVKYFNVYTSKNGDVSFGCGFNNIGNAKYHGIQYAETAGPFETYKYLDGEITKVEESSNAD